MDQPDQRRRLAVLAPVPPEGNGGFDLATGSVAVEYAEDYYRGDRTTFRVRLDVLEHGLGEKTRHEHIAL